MADEKLNQDKPVNFNEQNQDVSKNEMNGEGATAYPTGASVPLQSNVDYDQVSGMVTADRASANREETAAEIAVPANIGRDHNSDHTSWNNEATGMVTANRASANREETAAEIAAPVNIGRGRNADRATGNNAGTGMNVLGMSALAISIISLFVLPIVLGITGIVLGFMARSRQGSNGVANWAIGVGAVSLIIGMFILPFY